MASRIVSGIAPALKSARPPKGLKHRAPRARLEDLEHLRLIRLLPCLTSGETPAGEAAHVRYASAAYGKPITGGSTRPDDKWTVPLCPRLHTMSSDAQHRSGEEWWWEERNINPLLVAVRLYERSVFMREASAGEDEIVRQLSRIIIDARRDAK